MQVSRAFTCNWLQTENQKFWEEGRVLTILPSAVFHSSHAFTCDSWKKQKRSLFDSSFDKEVVQLQNVWNTLKKRKRIISSVCYWHFSLKVLMTGTVHIFGFLPLHKYCLDYISLQPLHFFFKEAGGNPWVFKWKPGLKLSEILRSSTLPHQSQPKGSSETLSSAEYYF